MAGDDVAKMKDGMARDETAVGRRRMLRGLAGAGTVGLASVLGARPAAAADGDTLMLGAENTASSPTQLKTTFTGDGSTAEFSAFHVEAVGDDSGSDLMPFALSAYAAHSTAMGAGTDDGFAAVWAQAGDAIALAAENSSAGKATIAGYSRGRAAALAGASTGGAQLLLEPEEGRVGPPSGYFPTGSILLDSVGDLHIRTGEADTQWARLVREDQLPAADGSGRTVAVPPVRALATTLQAGQTRTVVLDPAATGVPADATVVLGSITAASAGYRGRLLVAPAGVSQRAFAVSFVPGQASTAGFTCGVTSRPKGAAFTVRASGSSTRTVRVQVDVTAYVTG
jgi:hypothetical protein